MATLQKRKLPSGETVWLLTHGTEPNRQRFVAGRSYEEASEVLRQFTQQLALHGHAPTNDSFDATLGRFLTHLKGNRRASTYRRYARVLQTFQNCFLIPFHPGVFKLQQIKPHHLEEYKQRRLEGTVTGDPEKSEEVNREGALRRELALRPRSATRQDNARFGWLGRKRLRRCITPRTVNYELRVLGTFCRWAIRHNELFVNPTSTVERCRIPKRALPKFLTAEELKKVLAACDERDRRLFAAILLTGMRKGEIEHLTWSDISLELGVIFIQEKPDLNWKPKTDERLIPISPMLREILATQRGETGGHRFVFPNEAGNRDTHILHRFKNLCGKAGIKSSSVHALRHSFGAHLRMAGVSLADIGDLLGHRDLATTQIYARVHQEHLRHQIGRINAVVGDALALPAPNTDPATIDIPPTKKPTE